MTTLAVRTGRYGNMGRAFAAHSAKLTIVATITACGRNGCMIEGCVGPAQGHGRTMACSAFLTRRHGKMFNLHGVLRMTRAAFRYIGNLRVVDIDDLPIRR